jgi:nucleotide-binding universal stress UspA family protein
MARRYRTILCPTDLSPVGNAAVPLAYALAGPGATVHLLYAVDPPYLSAIAYGQFTPGYVPTPEEIRAEVEGARSRLALLPPPEAASEGIRTEIHVVEGIGAAHEIEQAARRLDAEIVVMATHGRTGIGRVLLGSVAMDMMRRRGIPLLLLHDDPVRASGKAAGVAVKRADA